MQGIKDILDALKQLQSTIYLACDEKPADDISKIVRDAVTEITSLREQLEIAKKDGERLDYLDSLNDKLNQHYKTNYGFKLHCSCNVIRIYSQSVNHIDLNDANSGIDKYTKVREAIDNVMKV